jgi:hypothetical protein
MGDLSKLLVAPKFSTALGVAMPFASGVMDLRGRGSGKMQLGMHQRNRGSLELKLKPETSL